ncbi:MAG: hypothetical protein A2173_11665 [Planctomycetes bacterium RBG_13_44_8b]|nr:MAG: hypothetical protein A2173_11665 [Planctomycetes bacterium RBG_13_44_8b]
MVIFGFQFGYLRWSQIVKLLDRGSLSDGTDRAAGLLQKKYIAGLNGVKRGTFSSGKAQLYTLSAIEELVEIQLF